MIPRDVAIVSACRTAIGKANKGKLAHVRPETLASAVLTELVQRTQNLKAEQIDDVILGCAFPEGSQGLNVARVAVLTAGWPDRIPAFTLNRFCASGLESVAVGAQRIAMGAADIVIAGGVESMSQVPMGGFNMTPNPSLVDIRPSAYDGMGATAENVAEKYTITREDQDVFALGSQQKAATAVKNGAFKTQIVPLSVPIQTEPVTHPVQFSQVTVDRDEGVRADTTLEALSKLPPVFKKGGTVTAGNASQTSDGAAGLILMAEDTATELGLHPMAYFRNYTVEGCSPEFMGLGPVKAVPKLLKRAHLTMTDIGLIELNEAFAAQSLACMRELKLNHDVVNVNGGAIALGHPLGCTGSFLSNKLIYEMIERQVQWGIVTMCVGFGMGAAGLFELGK